jgi:ATP-dependent protease ClpP protease subunit
MTTPLLNPEDFRNPAILLSGHVDQALYKEFRRQLDKAPEQGLVVTEITTPGGDPEVARQMGEDIRFHSEHDKDRTFVFLGKATVYSAGATFMSFFARDNRYLARGARLMIHERQNTDCTIKLSGPVSCAIPMLQAKLHEMQTAVEIQNEGFKNLVEGSSVSHEEVIRRATSNWYMAAEEALRLGLVRAVV